MADTPPLTRSPGLKRALFASLRAFFASVWQRKRARTAFFYGAYLLLTTALLYVVFRNWAYDDPFITYRYAANLVNGLGFVYNAGEQTLSTTTPLFTLLLAGLSFVWSDLPGLANLLGAFGLASGGLLLWDMGRVMNAPLVSLAGLLLYPTFFLLPMTTGSETPLYLAFCLGAFAAFARRRFELAALSSALAFLTRPDGLLVPAILALAYLPELWKHRGSLKAWPWQAVLIFLGVTAPWLLFAWMYFGSLTPATLATKQMQAQLAGSLSFARGFLNLLAWFRDNPAYWLEAGLAGIGTAWALRFDRRWLPLLAWPVIYFAGYYLLRVSAYHWYYAPLAPSFLAAAGLGLHALLQLFQGKLAGNRNQAPGTANRDQLPAPASQRAFFASPRAIYWAAAVLLCLIAAAQVVDTWKTHLQPDSRVKIYTATGRWIAQHTAPDARVATIEIGIIGYYARRYIIDFAGLLQPEAAAQLLSGSNYDRAAKQISRRFQPDYIIVQKDAFTELEATYIAARCTLEQQFPGKEYGYKGMLHVYACH